MEKEGGGREGNVGRVEDDGGMVRWDGEMESWKEKLGGQMVDGQRHSARVGERLYFAIWHADSSLLCVGYMAGTSKTPPLHV